MFQHRRMPVFLRLTASLLAATGLLGHGIAMLLVGLLASPVSAEPDTRYFSEICTPGGLVSLADLESRDSGEDDGQHSDPLKSCPVCTAYAQAGAADLPVALAAPATECCSATQHASPDSVAQSSATSDAQPRAPPAGA
jgi:Protein of unknown function (DUF2946)